MVINKVQAASWRWRPQVTISAVLRAQKIHWRWYSSHFQETKKWTKSSQSREIPFASAFRVEIFLVFDLICPQPLEITRRSVTGQWFVLFPRARENSKRFFLHAMRAQEEAEPAAPNTIQTAKWRGKFRSAESLARYDLYRRWSAANTTIAHLLPLLSLPTTTSEKICLKLKGKKVCKNIISKNRFAVHFFHFNNKRYTDSQYVFFFTSFSA